MAIERGRIGFAGLLLTFAFSFAGCSGPKAPEFGRPEVAAIQKLMQDFAAGYNAKDVEKTVATFAGTAVLFPPNRSALRGADPIRGYYRTRFAEGATDLVVDLKDIAGSGTLAYASGTYSFRNRPESGIETRDRGKCMWIVRNMGGGRWRWEYQMWNSDLPVSAPETPAK